MHINFDITLIVGLSFLVVLYIGFVAYYLLVLDKPNRAHKARVTSTR